MLISELTRGRPPSEVAKLLGAPLTSVTQWASKRAAVVDYVVYLPVKRVGGFPAMIPDEWVWLYGTWYRPSCAKPVMLEGSKRQTVADSLAAGRNPREPIPGYVMTPPQAAALSDFAAACGLESLSDAADAILGVAKPV